MIEALAAGVVDAVALGRGRQPGRRPDPRWRLCGHTAHDSRVEVGGFALAAADAELAACLDRPHRLADRQRAHRLPGVAGRARDLHAARPALTRRGVRLNGYEWRRRPGRTHEEVWDRLRGGENRKCARMVRRAEKWPSLPASTSSGSDRRSANRTDGAAPAGAIGAAAAAAEAQSAATGRRQRAPRGAMSDPGRVENRWK